MLTSPATLGARLLHGGPRSKAVEFVLLAGYDFPEAILHLLQEWETRLHVHKDAEPSVHQGPVDIRR